MTQGVLVNATHLLIRFFFSQSLNKALSEFCVCFKNVWTMLLSAGLRFLYVGTKKFLNL